jgi:hypothetical protein
MTRLMIQTDVLPKEGLIVPVVASTVAGTAPLLLSVLLRRRRHSQQCTALQQLNEHHGAHTNHGKASVHALLHTDARNRQQPDRLLAARSQQEHVIIILMCCQQHSWIYSDATVGRRLNATGNAGGVCKHPQQQSAMVHVTPNPPKIMDLRAATRSAVSPMTL